MKKAQRYVEQTRSFLRDYVEGFEVDELRRMFDRDAANVYDVLARDQPTEEEPKDGFEKFLYKTKVVFLGLSYKLPPSRRMLFAFSLLLALLGLVSPMILRDDSWFPLGPSILFLASVAGLAYLLAMELVDRIRVRDELEVARQLQGDLLPDDSPELRGYGFAHSYRTANTIGGDYYDFITLDDGRLAVVVGDASGHGIAAGLLMAIANATLKTALDVDPEPAAVASFLNRTLCRTGDRRAFMTLFYAVLDPATGRLEYTCAGHPFPLLRRAGGSIAELGKGNLPLGIRPDLEFTSESTNVDEGDILLAFSDGLPEAVDSSGRAFGFDRLRHLLENVGTPQAVHDRILVAFERHLGQEPLTDDLTIVVVSRFPEVPDGA